MTNDTKLALTSITSGIIGAACMWAAYHQPLNEFQERKAYYAAKFETVCAIKLGDY